jgi:polyvinyl alcohol dehydrogenase (cytochrome)
LLVLLAVAALGEVANAAADSDDVSGGAGTFAQRCASCHDQPVGRTPSTATLRQRTPEQLFQTMRTGVMRVQTAGLTVYQMQGVANFLTGRMPNESNLSVREPNQCKRNRRSAGARGLVAVASATLLAGDNDWNGWGRDHSNTRFAANSGINAADVPRLKVKWAFGYRGSYIYGQPVVAGGRVYVTSSSGRVYSLDTQTGCVHWSFDAESGARSAINVGAAGDKTAIFFGDDAANVYALDAVDGSLLWKHRVDAHVSARITGATQLLNDVLYVPVAALEEVAAADSKYPCCTFAGSLQALDARTGKVIWVTKLLPAAQPLRINEAGTQLYGPAGVSIWNSPTIDVQRGLIYVATGNSYTDVPAPTADAIIAMRLSDGTIEWTHQLTPNDNFTMSCARALACPAGPIGQPCELAGKANCPNSAGPDVDFAASSILRDLPDGRRVLIASQKSGLVYALDTARKGELLWTARVGVGSPLGGIEWGTAADQTNVYAPVSDILLPPGTGQPGLTALDLASGARRWHVSAPVAKCSWGEASCSNAFMQAATVIPGLVFAGALDGHLRGYDSGTGALRWDFDTGGSFKTVNKVPATGGSLDMGGPVLANGMLFVNSGYGRLVGKPGNVLLAFSVDGR